MAQGLVGGKAALVAATAQDAAFMAVGIGAGRGGVLLTQLFRDCGVIGAGGEDEQRGPVSSTGRRTLLMLAPTEKGRHLAAPAPFP